MLFKGNGHYCNYNYLSNINNSIIKLIFVLDKMLKNYKMDLSLTKSILVIVLYICLHV